MCAWETPECSLTRVCVCAVCVCVCHSRVCVCAVCVPSIQRKNAEAVDPDEVSGAPIDDLEVRAKKYEREVGAPQPGALVIGRRCITECV